MNCGKGLAKNQSQQKKRRWKWIGHTLRKDNNSIVCQALEWNSQGTKKRGRPKNTWRRGLQKDLLNANLTWEQAKRTAKNRPTWRATVNALCPPPPPPPGTKRNKSNKSWHRNVTIKYRQNAKRRLNRHLDATVVIHLLKKLNVIKVVL